jgi:hypothetical protein
LTIAVGVIVGEVATGLFQRLGADLYDQLKGRLAQLVEDRERPFLIDFDITFERSGRTTVHVLLDGPNRVELEDLFDRRFDGFDIEIDRCLANVSETDRIVTTWKDGNLLLNYAVRRDGVPVLMGRAIPENLSGLPDGD